MSKRITSHKNKNHKNLSNLAQKFYTIKLMYICTMYKLIYADVIKVRNINKIEKPKYIQ